MNFLCGYVNKLLEKDLSSRWHCGTYFPAIKATLSQQHSDLKITATPSTSITEELQREREGE